MAHASKEDVRNVILDRLANFEFKKSGKKPDPKDPNRKVIWKDGKKRRAWLFGANGLLSTDQSEVKKCLKRKEGTGNHKGCSDDISDEHAALICNIATSTKALGLIDGSTEPLGYQVIKEKLKANGLEGILHLAHDLYNDPNMSNSDQRNALLKHGRSAYKHIMGKSITKNEFEKLVKNFFHDTARPETSHEW